MLLCRRGSSSRNRGWRECRINMRTVRCPLMIRWQCRGGHVHSVYVALLAASKESAFSDCNISAIPDWTPAQQPSCTTTASA